MGKPKTTEKSMEANRIDGIDLVSEKEKGRKEKERWGWKGWERCRNGGGPCTTSSSTLH